MFQHFAKAVTLGGLAFLLLPVPSPVPALVQRLDAQAFPGRLRRPPMQPGEAGYPPPGPQTSAPAPAAPQPAAPVPQPAPAGALPPSMLQQPAQPATVKFTAQSLSIHADNSSLGDILRQLSRQTGMDVQGFGKDDERVFGSFGPGNPQDVVSDLLNGTPYNVLMVGVLANGAPRQLVLSPPSHLAASVAPSSPPPKAADDSDDAQPVPQVEPAPNPTPGKDPAAPSGAPTVKSPQELFQQLQQMRNRQQQAQQQPQPAQQPQQ